MEVFLAEPEYRALNRESYSSLKHLLDSIDAYLHNKKEPFKGNARTVLGTAIHMAIQNIDKIKVIPNIKGTKKDGTESKFNDKQAQEEWIKAEIDKDPEICCITESQWEVVQAIVEKAKLLKLENITKDLRVETAHLFEINGIKLKGRIDFQGEDIIYDVKTTESSLAAFSFKYNIMDSHYDMQAAMYQEAVFQATGKRLPYKIIAINTKAPYEIKIFSLSQATLDFGRKKLERCLYLLSNLETLRDTIIEEEV